ncbi:MAG: DUF4199 domain-containing protein [Bacteroidota bacterium]
MENRVSPWKANLNAGIILGLLGIIWTLVLWFLNQTTNNTLGLIFWAVIIIGLFLGIKSYRDKYLNGFITYGQSLGASFIIILYFSIVLAIFNYILYKWIDPDLTDKLLNSAEEFFVERSMTEGSIEQLMQMLRKIITPFVLSIFVILYRVFVGAILSLIIGLFTKREGNPLINEAIAEEEDN